MEEEEEEEEEAFILQIRVISVCSLLLRCSFSLQYRKRL
jgi:hypothetical protein